MRPRPPPREIRSRSRCGPAQPAHADRSHAPATCAVGRPGSHALRQHIRATERLHGIITDGGQAPNIVPETAAGRFYVRAANSDDLAALKQRLENCFQAGATATGATVEIAWGEADYLDIRYNAPLAESFRANAEKLGREFFPYDRLPASIQGSTDLGNVSQRVPSIHPMLAAAPLHCTIHNAEFEKWSGSEMGDAAALDGAKALAMTAIDFLCDPDLQRRTRDWFDSAGRS
jgi:metal-dependent amidase/aminoacylase/carboxypeptidase family protein